MGARKRLISYPCLLGLFIILLTRACSAQSGQLGAIAMGQQLSFIPVYNLKTGPDLVAKKHNQIFWHASQQTPPDWFFALSSPCQSTHFVRMSLACLHQAQIDTKALLQPPAAQISPVYIGAPPSRSYPKSWHYEAFKKRYKNRTAMVYSVLANGTIYGYQADTGSIRFAFLPPKLATQSPQTKTPKTPVKLTKAQVVMDHQWQNLLIATYPKQIIVFNVTQPEQFETAAPNTVIAWTIKTPDKRYFTHSPIIVRLNTGSWAAILGNGEANYPSEEPPTLWVLDAKNGHIIRQLVPASGFANNPNGLGAVTPVDTTQDFTTDYIIAGDLGGHLWLFNLEDKNTNHWHVAYSGQALFKALDFELNPLSITAAPLVLTHPLGPDYGLMAFFGTGSCRLDQAGPRQQFFYGVQLFPSLAAETSLSLGQLVIQKTIESDLSTPRFIASNNPVSYAQRTRIKAGHKANRGWAIQLPKHWAITLPALFYNRRLFISLTDQSLGPCQAGANGAILEVKPMNGGSPNYPKRQVDPQSSDSSNSTSNILLEKSTPPPTQLSAPSFRPNKNQIIYNTKSGPYVLKIKRITSHRLNFKFIE